MNNSKNEINFAQNCDKNPLGILDLVFILGVITMAKGIYFLNKVCSISYHIYCSRKLI